MARQVQEEQLLRVLAQREARQEQAAVRAAKVGKKSTPIHTGADILKAGAQAQEDKKKKRGPLMQAFNAAGVFVSSAVGVGGGEGQGKARKLAKKDDENSGDDHGPFSVIGKAGLHMMHDNQRLRGR